MNLSIRAAMAIPPKASKTLYTEASSARQSCRSINGNFTDGTLRVRSRQPRVSTTLRATQSAPRCQRYEILFDRPTSGATAPRFPVVNHRWDGILSRVLAVVQGLMSADNIRSRQAH